MGTFLYKAALGLLVVQSPMPTRHGDTVRAGLWARVAADSTDAAAWLDIGRSYLQLGDYHAHRRPVVTDTVWAHAQLDTAAHAFERAARWSTGTRTADSARVFRVYTFGERAYVDWESGGSQAAMLAWHALPEGLRLPPALEELGENLLRACPRQGILLTAYDTDTEAAWYLRFARGLRPDLVIVPAARWQVGVGEGKQSGPGAGAGFRVRRLTTSDRSARDLDRACRPHLSARGEQGLGTVQGVRHVRAGERGWL